MSFRWTALLSLVAVSLHAQAPTLPRLRHAFTSTDVDLAPINRLTPIAVGPQGHVLFVGSAESSDRKLALVDSTGRLLLRIGRPGAGPGEVRSPQPVEISTNRVAVWDRENAVLLEWDLAGALQQSIKPMGLSEVAFVGRETVGMRFAAGSWRVVAVERATGQLRALIPPTDTFTVAHFGLVNGRSKSPYAPITGAWAQGFVVADPATYAVALYRWDGTLVRVLRRTLPPIYPSAARIDEFLETFSRQAAERGQPPLEEAQKAMLRKQGAEQQLAYITPGGAIRTDARNRMWVLGMEGDSAFADVFTADRFLGRLAVPCRLYNGSWSLAGAWLAVTCVPDDREFDGEAVLKLFRIVEGAR